MQKVFALLLSEFRKLGATIIFANFSKIIVDTGKYDLSAAKAYCDSLLRTIQSRFVLPATENTAVSFDIIRCMLSFKLLKIHGKGNKTWTTWSTTSFKSEKVAIFY